MPDLSQLAAEIERYGAEVTPSPTQQRFVFVLDGRRIDTDDGVAAVRSNLTQAGAPLAEASKRVHAALEAGDASVVADLDVACTDWVATQPLSPSVREFLLAYAASMGGGRPAQSTTSPG